MYKDLEKLDKRLGLPLGTSNAAFVDFDKASIALMNEELTREGIVFNESTLLVSGQPAWQILCQEVGLGSEWWMADRQEPPDVVIPNL